MKCPNCNREMIEYNDKYVCNNCPELIASKNHFFESLPVGASVTGIFRTDNIIQKPDPNTAYGVREYSEDYPVLIKKYEDNDRWVVQAFNENQYNSTSTDLLDILVWTIRNHLELLEEAKILAIRGKK